MNEEMIQAIKDNNTKLIYDVIKNDYIDLNFQDKLGNTLLHYAINLNQLDAAFLLLEAGSNFRLKNNDNKTAFELAEGQNDQVMMTLFSDKQQKLDRLLIKSIFYSDLETAEMCLKHGANPNFTSTDGMSLLHRAVFSSSTAYFKYECASLLLDFGADTLNKSDNLGNTPLHYAAAKGNEVIYYFLLDEKADPNIKNKDNKTAKELYGESHQKAQKLNNLPFHKADQKVNEPSWLTAFSFF